MTPYTLNSELLRKAIHFFFIASVAWVHAQYQRSIFLGLLVISSLVMLCYEYLRRHHALCASFFSPILRAHEAKHWTGASYVLCALWLGLVFFPTDVYRTALWILACCDTAAALVGQMLSRARGKKTYGGTAAFVLVGLGVLYFTQGLSGLSCFALGVTAWVEYRSADWGWDDNLSVPLSFGFVYDLGSFFLR